METKNSQHHHLNKSALVLMIGGIALFIVLLVLFSAQAGVKLALQEQSADAAVLPSRTASNCLMSVSGTLDPAIRSRVTLSGKYDATAGSGNFVIPAKTLIVLSGKFTSTTQLEVPCKSIVRGILTAKAQSIALLNGLPAYGNASVNFNGNSARSVNLKINLTSAVSSSPR